MGLPMAAVLLLAAAFVAQTGHIAGLAATSADTFPASNVAEGRSEQQQTALRPLKALPEFELLAENKVAKEEQKQEEEADAKEKKGKKAAEEESEDAKDDSLKAAKEK